MRVIHNNLQRACETSPPASVMDRLRNNLNQLCPLLRARYRKLFDDYASSKENIPLLIQSKDYISYSCSCCGRTQKLQVCWPDDMFSGIVGRPAACSRRGESIQAADIQDLAGRKNGNGLILLQTLPERISCNLPAPKR